MSAVAPSSSYPPHPYSIEPFAVIAQNRTRNQAKELVNKARDFFKNLPPPRAISCPLSQVDVPSLLKEIYDTNGFSGLCIGEFHNQTAPKKVIIEAMPQLKDMGITTFFCEHIKSGKMQKELDGPDLPKFLEQLDKKYHLLPPYSYTDLIKSAKEVGIRVVAIDSPISAIAGCHPDLMQDTAERIVAMNYTAKLIMTKEKWKGKCIVLTGVNHGSEIIVRKGSEIKDSGIPGISELMEWPFVIFADASACRKPGVYLNPRSVADFGYKNKEGTVHAIYIMDKPSTTDSPRRNTF